MVIHWCVCVCVRVCLNNNPSLLFQFSCRDTVSRQRINHGNESSNADLQARYTIITPTRVPDAGAQVPDAGDGPQQRGTTTWRRAALLTDFLLLRGPVRWWPRLGPLGAAQRLGTGRTVSPTRDLHFVDDSEALSRLYLRSLSLRTVDSRSSRLRTERLQQNGLRSLFLYQHEPVAFPPMARRLGGRAANQRRLGPLHACCQSGDVVDRAPALLALCSGGGGPSWPET